MKVNFSISPMFMGVREDRNTTTQLKKNNAYSLTEPNQRRINKAIENLAKQKGEENIQFLLDIGENLKYQTNIDNGKITKNDWRGKLKAATEESLAHSNPILREKYEPEIERVFVQKKELSNDERAILSHRNAILKYADLDSLKDNPNKNIQNLERNMDYFITSTETSTEQKEYVMKKLRFFMSPGYKINHQLKDKKTQVLAEMMNDLAITTPESDIPNIKAVNQKTHGMCAAISIARKAMAYEDKPNYVDSILSELDEKDVMKVYDRQNLGSGTRVPVQKTIIDFDYAQEKGYRIIDASTLQWMNIAGMYGAKNIGLHEFNAFDKNNFDAFHDSFFLRNLSDDGEKRKQCYYQALTKAKEDIGSVKSSKIKSDLSSENDRRNYSQNLDLVSKLSECSKKEIKAIVPSITKEELGNTRVDLLQLYKPTSEQIDKNVKKLREYSFLPNEEELQKEKKIKQYFVDMYGSRVNSEVLNQTAGNVVSTIEETRAVEKALHNSDPLSKKIANARKLYEAEAIYRASIAIGLCEEDNYTDNLIRYNVPDRESNISNGYATVIEKIEKNNDQKLLNHFAPMFSTTPDDKEGVVLGLKEIKRQVDNLINGGLSVLYNYLGYDKGALLLNDLQTCREAVKAGNKEELYRSSVCLGVKKDKNHVLKEYDKLEAKMMNNPDDNKVYTEVFNKMGYKNQCSAYVDVFKSRVDTLMDRENPDYDKNLQIFKAMTGLPEDASVEDVINVINAIGSEYETVANSLENAADMLNVTNEDGSLYFTVSGKHTLMKKMEKEGKLVPEKDMVKLQDRFTKIDKIRSSDEFSSRQGKISQPELYKLSDSEKQAIKQIDGKLNKMYSEVTRELNHQFRELKGPLENLAKDVGTDEGKYWIPKEGSSGLYGDQQVKIFEQMTDRPYYENEDINDAVDIIKNGEHSGVSSSSVFHDRIGGHAQYVADVRENEDNHKMILFHDNTWGASEHENTWIDSEGLVRTDYSDRRGGELGYITDSEWRNGNYVENLTNKKGHVSGEHVESRIYNKMNPGSNSDFDFTLMSGIILPGENPKYKDIAGSIKDTMFIPDSMYVNDIEKYAKGMTKKQLQKAFFRNEVAGTAYRDKYKKIMDRIEPGIIKKGINSLEDYNKLSDNDMLKVAFEKAAIREAYPDASMYKELASATTMKDVQKIAQKQKDIAKSNFNYAFGKETDILLHAAYEHGVDMSNALITSLIVNGVSVEESKLSDILKNIAVYVNDEKKQFNGSMKDTIQFSVDKALKQFDEVVPASENAKKAREQFGNDFKGLLEDTLYFSKEDLKSNTDKAKGIRNWIDEKFNPKTDDEFVQIYRSLQDMTKEEFDKLTSDLTNKQLGIKDITGYDMLVKVKASNDDAISTLRNTLFYDEYSKDMNISKTKPAYKYLKTERKTRGAIYKGKRTFDDLYRSMYFSLSTLEYEKMFNKYKDVNFRKYQALPAYPKMEYGNDPVVADKLKTTFDLVDQTYGAINAQKNVLFDMRLGKKLDEYRRQIPEGRKLTPTERKTINAMVGSYITNNHEDSDLEKSLDASYKLLELDKNADISEYNKHIDVIVHELKMIEKLNTEQALQDSIRSHIDGLNNYLDVLVKTNIPPRYHKKMKAETDELIRSVVANAPGTNGLDSDKAMTKLYRKAFEHSVGNEKDKIDAFTRATDAISKAAAIKHSKNMTPEKLQEQMQRVEKYSDRFVNKYVDESHRRFVKSEFEKYTDKRLAGHSKKGDLDYVLDFREKFEKDFKKYHLTNYPTEILNNFLLYSASDAEKTREQDVYKSYLNRELDAAQLIDIQDSLMEAVQTGNASEVRNHFDEYYVDLYNNGTVVSMNSDDAIDHMVRSLVIEDNTKTAKMFVEKLGLGDRVMSIERDLLKNIQPKKNIDNIATMLKETASLATIVKTEMSNLNAVIDSDDIIAEIDKSKKNIIKKSKKLTDKKPVKIYLSYFDEIKKSLTEDSDVPRGIIFSQYFNGALTAAGNYTNENIEQEQNVLNAVNLMYKFLLELELPEYSKGYKTQQEVKKDYEDLTEYNDNAIYGSIDQNNTDATIMLKDS